jgi:hypothetical protein
MSIRGGAALCAVAAIALLEAALEWPGKRAEGFRAAHWSNIGGCGTSSGSVASDLGLKWIGRGLSGPLLETEVTAMQSFQSDSAVDPSKGFDGRLRLRTNSFLLNAQYHARWGDLKATLPLLVRQANILGTVSTTGPLGDFALELSRPWGEARSWRARLGLGFPTGAHDIPLDRTRYLLPEMQTGSGLFTASLGLDRAFDRDWGFFSFGGDYALGLAALLTQEYGYDAGLNQAVSAKKSPRWARDGLGARNDIGTVLPDYFSVHADLGVKSEALVQGLTASLGFPLREGAYEERNQEVTPWSSRDPAAAQYFPERGGAQAYADTVGKGGGAARYQSPLVAAEDAQGRWIVMDRAAVARQAFPSLTLQYSVEKSDINVPLLFGGSMRWDFNGGPVFAGFGLGLGIKFGML